MSIGVPSSQNWEDPDIPELLTWLEDELRAHIAELSSFDVYKKEVLSGSLDWTPMHTSVCPQPCPPWRVFSDCVLAASVPGYDASLLAHSALYMVMPSNLLWR